MVGRRAGDIVPDSSLHALGTHPAKDERSEKPIDEEEPTAKPSESEEPKANEQKPGEPPTAESDSKPAA